MLRKSLWLTMVICLALALACSQEGAGPAEITLNPNQQAPATGAEAVAPPRNETAQVQTAAGSSSQAQAAAANRSDIPNTSRTAPVNQGGGVTTMPTGVEQPETTETMPDATSQTEAVVKKDDFSNRDTANLSCRRGLRRAAAPTVQGGSARESHPGTPNGSPLRPTHGPQSAGQPEPDWVCVSASPAGAALQAPVSAVPEPHPSTSTRASPASLQVR